MEIERGVGKEIKMVDANTYVSSALDASATLCRLITAFFKSELGFSCTFRLNFVGNIYCYRALPSNELSDIYKQHAYHFISGAFLLTILYEWN